MSLRAVVVTAVAVTAVATLVGSSDATTSPRRSDPYAVKLLQRAVIAEAARAYAGTEVLSDTERQPSTERLQVTHLPAQGTVMVEPAAAGQPARAAFTPLATPTPSLLIWLLTSSYSLVLDGRESVAGRSAQIVEAVRPDGSPAGRFWLDTATGLMLRRDVLDSAGLPVRSLAFAQLVLNTASPAHLPPIATSASQLQVNSAVLKDWRDRGWSVGRSLAGMTLFDARTVEGVGEPVLHLSYSDGLSSVSVFVQAGSVDTAALDQMPGTNRSVINGQLAWVRSGQPEELTWSSSGWVITVVADAPRAVVAAVAGELPHAAAISGWSRVWRGLSRVGSWLNPFN
jgi:sigma-E factor negative regulatory protein RseB